MDVEGGVVEAVVDDAAATPCGVRPTSSTAMFLLSAIVPVVLGHSICTEVVVKAEVRLKCQ